MIWRNKPRKFILYLDCVSEISFWLCSWSNSGEVNGAERDAFRFEEIFPLDTTYMLQKSGAAFDTLLGTSALNFLQDKNYQNLENFN